jgi:hypothetical protein
MIVRNVYPKTKQELIDALKASKVTSFQIFDALDNRTNAALRKPQKLNSKRTLIIIDEIM